MLPSSREDRCEVNIRRYIIIGIEKGEQKEGPNL